MVHQLGDFVRIRNIVNNPTLNGRLALVVRFTEDFLRCGVVLGHDPKIYSILEANLTPAEFSQLNTTRKIEKQPWFSNDRRYQVCEFWPNHLKGTSNVKVNPITNWPADWTQEIPFLREIMHWGRPVVVGGVTSRGQPKPDFMFYFDAEDQDSIPNIFAKQMLRLLPHYEMQKIADDLKEEIRGNCVLVYSPMITPESKMFTMAQLRDVIEFHGTQDADKMYDAHDNPYHRVFGGLV